MAEIAAGLPDGKKFDAVIVDEAQDFADHWWHPLHEGAARRGRGRSLRLLRREPAHLRPIRPAAGAARPARARPQPAQHPADRTGVRAARAHADARRAAATGADVRFVPCRREDAIGRRRRPGRPAARRRAGSPARRAADHGQPSPRADRAQEPHGQRRLLADASGTTTRSSTATSSAARDSNAAPSCSASTRRQRDRARERLYVGMSRATDQLVVVGDPVHPRDRRRPGGAPTGIC